MQSILLNQRLWNAVGKVLSRHQLDISVFSELYRCGLQQWDLDVGLQRAAYNFANSLGGLGIPTEPVGSFLSWFSNE